MQTNISRLLQTWSTFTFQRDDYNSKSDCRQGHLSCKSVRRKGGGRWRKGGAALYRVIKTNIFKFTRNQSNNHPSQAASSHHIRTWGCHASPLGAHARVFSDNFETKSLNLHAANISIAMAHVFVFHKFVFFQCIFRFVCVCDLFPSKCAAHAQQRKTRGRERERDRDSCSDR